jgi:hypothetical protein
MLMSKDRPRLCGCPGNWSKPWEYGGCAERISWTFNSPATSFLETPSHKAASIALNLTDEVAGVVPASAGLTASTARTAPGIPPR